MALNFDNVTNEQLYALSQNKGICKAMRSKAKNELTSRANFTEKTTSLLYVLAESATNKKKPLPLGLKIFLVIFPFFEILQLIVTAIFFPLTTTSQWKQFWYCKAIQIVLITILVWILGTTGAL